MRNFIKYEDKETFDEIFAIADNLEEYNGILKGKTVILLFPETSYRTRIAFEKAVYELGGHTIFFPAETLDKKEDIRDVAGYMSALSDMVIIRHNSYELIENFSEFATVPVINAMTKTNHPCEIISDIYGLSKLRDNYCNLKYVFVGACGNIGLSWLSASRILNFSFIQCCPEKYRMSDVQWTDSVESAVKGADIILTDSLSSDKLEDFKNFQITRKLLDMADDKALLNPCPPFFRGEEVSADAISSRYFVGYDFKRNLTTVHKAIIIYCMK